MLTALLGSEVDVVIGNLPSAIDSPEPVTRLPGASNIVSVVPGYTMQS
ncbi:hypothetical protein [Delftia tsuruhatensis]